MNRPVIVIGGGGHAKVLISTLLSCSHHILGFTDPDERRQDILGVSRMGDHERVFLLVPSEVLLVNGLGSTGSTERRMKAYERFKDHGYTFATIRHPSAVVTAEVEVGEGVQILAGAVIQAGTRIADNVIINTRVGVDHDCNLESHVHLAPGVTLSGGVIVGAGVHVGTGACVIQNIRIGRNCVVGAGAVVIRDVPEGHTVFGVPAKSTAP